MVVRVWMIEDDESKVRRRRRNRERESCYWRIEVIICVLRVE